MQYHFTARCGFVLHGHHNKPTHRTSSAASSVAKAAEEVQNYNLAYYFGRLCYY